MGNRIMGIDTRSKLNSMISFGDVWQPAIPIPDGSFDQGDLQHLLHMYSEVLKAIIIGDTITGLPCFTFTAYPISIGITGVSSCQ